MHTFQDITKETNWRRMKKTKEELKVGKIRAPEWHSQLRNDCWFQLGS